MKNVDAQVFIEFPMTMECRILRKIDESEEGYYIVAEIVNILVDEKYVGEDGNPDVAKMGLITYEPVSHGYMALGNRVGNAFAERVSVHESPGKQMFGINSLRHWE